MTADRIRSIKRQMSLLGTCDRDRPRLCGRPDTANSQAREPLTAWPDSTTQQYDNANWRAVQKGRDDRTHDSSNGRKKRQLSRAITHKGSVERQLVHNNMILHAGVQIENVEIRE